MKAKKAISYETECLHCRSVLQFTMADIHAGGDDINETIKCPVCGASIVIATRRYSHETFILRNNIKVIYEEESE